MKKSLFFVFLTLRKYRVNRAKKTGATSGGGGDGDAGYGMKSRSSIDDMECVQKLSDDPDVSSYPTLVLSVCLCLCLSMCMCRFVCMVSVIPLCVHICVFCVCVCVSMCMCVCLSVHVCLSASPYVCVSVCCLSFVLSLCRSLSSYCSECPLNLRLSLLTLSVSLCVDLVRLTSTSFARWWR